MLFTNQAGISLGKAEGADICGKISDLAGALNVPLQAFVASAKDVYRKPSTGMWARFVRSHNAGVQPDLSLCTFVGDAAGRARGWNGLPTTKRDHSLADRNFAHNVGLTFATPEPFFLGHREAPLTRALDVASFETAFVAESGDSVGGELRRQRCSQGYYLPLH